MLTSHHLVCIGVEKLGVWHLSALDWMDGGPLPCVDEASSQPVSPDIVVSDPWNYKTWDRLEFSRVSIPTVTESGVYFDVRYQQNSPLQRYLGVSSQPDGRGGRVWYRLDVTPHTSRSPHGLPISDQGARVALTLISVTRCPAPWFALAADFAHGQVCYVVHSPPMTCAYVPSDRPSITLMTPAKLEEGIALTKCLRLEAHRPHAFCPLSGRIIYIQWHLDERQQNVKVVDYLP